MYEIHLINMPFAGLHLPSLALTQLKAVLEREFGARVRVEIFYLNHDFAHFLGVDFYQHIATLSKGLWIGEWFFRQAAFPGLADNSAAYFRRFYPRRDARAQRFQRRVLEKRQGVDDFLDQLIEQHQLERAAITGFTSLFLQNTACFALARRLKQRRPDLLTVMGGAGCEAPMGDAIVKNVPQIDFVFSGPALKSFPAFVRCCLDGDTDGCQRIDGVFSKRNRVRWPADAASEAAPGPDDAPSVAPIGAELDIDTPIPLDYGPFLDAHERHFPGGQVGKVLLFETSRGCWWGERSQCTFCGFNGMNIHYRAMSPARAREQFEALFRYAPRCGYLWAVDSIMPQHYPREVFAHLDPPPNVEMGYELRVEFDERDVQTLARAHVRAVQPGIESLATPTLKHMRKGSSAFRNLIFLQHCVAHDVSAWWNLLIGFPGQDKKVAEATYRKYLHDIPLLLHLPPPAEVYPIRFDRYSHYFCQAERYGLALRPYDFYPLTYPFDDAVLADLAYCFDDDRNFKAEYFVTALRWLDKIRRQVNLWWTRWHGTAPSLAPRLFLQGQGQASSVYDSRSGRVIEYPVGEMGREALAYLDRPRRLSDLAAALEHRPDFDAGRTVAQFQEWGLLFQEGERFLSLVLPQEPPPLARFPQGQPCLDLLFTVYPNVALDR